MKKRRKRRKRRAVGKAASPRRSTTDPSRFLATVYLLYLLPVALLVGSVALWHWSAESEIDRVRELTESEVARVARVVADRLKGHADDSTRTANRWLLNGPANQAEWDYDIFRRDQLNPELETVEMINADRGAFWWFSRGEPLSPRIVRDEDLRLAVEEHRVVLTGPFFPAGREAVSMTIVPIERPGEPVRWMVSIYDLGYLLRNTLQGVGTAFAVEVSAGDRRIFATHTEEPPADGIRIRSTELGYDGLRLSMQVWPRPSMVDRFRTETPLMALVGGVMAAAVLVLGIRLAQVSGERAIEARMTAALQEEVRARKLAEKSLERKLRELSRSNEEFERFAYAISHDLRDPLNAINLNVQAVLSQNGDGLDDTDRVRLEKGARAVSRLDQMIGRLLEYARAGGGAEALELVDASEALDDATANLQALIESQRASVTSGRLPKVIAHKAALVRLFQNLVSNSIKYRTAEPPVVNVEAVKGDEEWVFSVADNARGMSKKEIANAFDLFWRNDASATTGNGIGLAVCKRITERHGGRMWIQSSPGEGTTFFFSWPADPDAVSSQRLSGEQGR